MKCTFEKFLEDNRNCSKFEGNRDAIEIFNIINRDDNIILAIEKSDNNIPALIAMVNEIEFYIDQQIEPSIDLNDLFVRTSIGKMVKSVLEPFGYLVNIQKDFPRNVNSKYFKSASCYKKDNTYTNTSMKVEKIVKAI